MLNKCRFLFGSGRLIWNHYSRLRLTEQEHGAGVSIYAAAKRERDRKYGLSWKSSVHFLHSCNLHLPPPHLSPPFYPSVLSDILPPLLSPAPAERLTRADEKGSSVKGQRWAATPRMPAPVQSNKAGCPPITGCLDGKTGSLLPLRLSLHWYQYATF